MVPFSFGSRWESGEQTAVTESASSPLIAATHVRVGDSPTTNHRSVCLRAAAPVRDPILSSALENDPLTEVVEEM